MPRPGEPATTLRRRTWLLLGLTLTLALLTAGALASALLVQIADAGVQAWSQPGMQTADALRGQLHGAEFALWLGLFAVLALAAGLGLALARLWILGPIEALARDAAVDLPHASEGTEIERITEALHVLRRSLGRGEVDRRGQLEAVGALRDAAESTLARLQEADRLALVGRVALGVAHEVGGPLAIVVAALERLQELHDHDGPLADKQLCLDRAGTASERIRTILHDMSEPGLPRTRDADRPTDLLAVALRVVALAEAHPRCRHLQLEIDAAESTHPADASASHLEQVALRGCDQGDGPGATGRGARRRLATAARGRRRAWHRAG
jgi:C4-dicarboxylate-specific signal transduction histidine kinase